MARILDQVVGHSTVIENLLSAIANRHLGSTLIFVGPSGIGKSKVALGVAQALVCESDSHGCGQCPSCVRMEKRQSEGLLFVEPEGTGIKIEQSRDILSFISLQKLGRARVVIIDQAHLLNPQAGNAILKSLEEPPPDTYFILITPNLSSLLPTIRSRGQVVRFAPLGLQELNSVTGAEGWVALSAQGSIAEAQRLQDSEWSDVRELAMRTLTDLISGHDGESFSALKELSKERGTAVFVAQCWQKLIRDALLWKGTGGSLRQDTTSGLINFDHIGLVQSLARIPDGPLHGLGEQALQLETDVLRNIDKALAFENFWLSLNSSLELDGSV